MSVPASLRSRKLILPVVAVAIAVLLAASISQTVESAGTHVRPRGTSTTTKTPKGKVSLEQPEQAAKTRRFPNMDVRVSEPDTMAGIASANASSITSRLQARKTAVEQALARLRAFSRGTQAKSSPLTGAVEVLRSTTGALTAPAPGRDAVDIVRSFIVANSDLYGLSSKDISSLRFLGESVSRGSGMRMVRVEQTVNGLPVFQSETRFILDAQGRVHRSTGLMIPNASATKLDFGGLISAQEALSFAMGSVDIQTDASQATPDKRKHRWHAGRSNCQQSEHRRKRHQQTGLLPTRSGSHSPRLGAGNFHQRFRRLVHAG